MYFLLHWQLAPCRKDLSLLRKLFFFNFPFVPLATGPGRVTGRVSLSITTLWQKAIFTHCYQPYPAWAPKYYVLNHAGACEFN